MLTETEGKLKTFLRPEKRFTAKDQSFSTGNFKNIY